MLFNRKNAHVTYKLIGILGKVKTTLNDSNLSTEEYKKQLGQKIVTIKWIVEQQINCLENASIDRMYLDRWLERELIKPQKDSKVIADIEQYQEIIDRTSRQAHWVISHLGDELKPLLLAYGRVADREEFAQLINASVVVTRWKTQAFDSFDKDTTVEEWKFVLEHLFLDWMLANQYHSFKNNPLSYALWESNIKKLPESDKLSTICIVGERIAAEKRPYSDPVDGQGNDFNF
jgi:hypothetical protein